VGREFPFICRGFRVTTPVAAAQTIASPSDSVQTRTAKKISPFKATAENCDIRKNTKFTKKTKFRVVPCSNPAHNVEVF
jgi:hypothetical protein